MFDIDKLIEKLARIEALYAGAATTGEKNAAGEARGRIIDRIRESKETDPPIEFSFSTGNPWSRKLLLALLRRYDIKPYRYHRQRYTTVRAKISKRFCNETLWPEYVALDRELIAQLEALADEVIHRSIHEDSSDAAEIAGLIEASGGPEQTVSGEA